MYVPLPVLLLAGLCGLAGGSWAVIDSRPRKPPNMDRQAGYDCFRSVVQRPPLDHGWQVCGVGMLESAQAMSAE
jgi:hypothetical protein